MLKDNTLPSTHRMTILAFLGRSILQVHALGPNRWGLTQLPDGIRLNAGWCEMCTVLPHEIRLLVHKDHLPLRLPKGVRLHLDRDREQGLPAIIPPPAGYYPMAPMSAMVTIAYKDALDLAKILDDFAPAHYRILEVGVRAPRSGGVKEGHSDVLVGELSTYLGTELPTPALSDSPKAFLFVTKAEYQPEDVMTADSKWSCSKDVKPGDQILVYVTGEGIKWAWRAISTSRPDPKWKFVCDVTFARSFDPLILLTEIRALVPPEEWKAVHTNLRGFRSIRIPIPSMEKILASRPASPETLGDLERQLAHEVEASKRLSSEERRRRLAAASPTPIQVQVQAYAFLRNQDVVAEVLIRANGVCEVCQQPAPFNRKSNGTPYLEVHHKVELSKGGLDKVENAVACCPNCHRQAHFG